MDSQESEKNLSLDILGFRGKYSHTIDPKGRLALPARFRRVFDLFYQPPDVFMTTDDRSNLLVYPLKVWAELEEEWVRLSRYDVNIKEQLFISSYFGIESSIDGTGRLLIPKSVRDSTGLTGDVVLIGTINHFEIWGKDAAEQRAKELLKKKDAGTRLSEIGDKIREFGQRGPRGRGREE